jgi:biotin carboxyl carrier protein
MTGTVIEVLVSIGEKVAVGHELLIVESMKMELPVESELAGTVAEVLVAPGQRVEEGDLLLRLES